MIELRDRIRAEVGKVVVGQEEAVDDLVCALLVSGHVLLEGVPGVAKTLLANATARALGLDFRRVQFTPDMLPSDLTGTMTLRGGELVFRPGPVFTSVLLADEINRTPPKTQAALLEAMQEGQVTVEGEPRPLPDPFLVLATQNPIEYEGTYPLPEAQLDRFLLKVEIGYPGEDAEKAVLRMRRAGVAPATLGDVHRAVTLEELQAAQRDVDATGVSDERASKSAPAPAPASTCLRRRRRVPGSRSAATSRLTTSPRPRPPCCAIDSCSGPRRSSSASAQTMR
jgi:MoxR-like ATPase